MSADMRPLLVWAGQVACVFMALALLYVISAVVLSLGTP